MQVDVARAKKVKSILVTLPKPENDKSPHLLHRSTETKTSPCYVSLIPLRGLSLSACRRKSYACDTEYTFVDKEQ